MNNSPFFVLAACAQNPYRIPIQVSHILCLPSGDSFPICPTCKITLEREYQSFCDRCGQKLDWKGLKNAKIIYPRQFPVSHD